MKRVVVPSMVLLAGIGMWAAVGGQPALKHYLHVSSTNSTPLTVAELAEAADIIAVVQPTGKDWVHWNSAANAPWSSSDERLPMIYNDQEVTVAELLRGSAAQNITIRNIGGVVGDTAFELEGLETLQPGSLYLVFLETVQTPTREGWETAISFLGQEQGVFVTGDDGGYVNVFGRRASLEDLNQ